MNRRDAVIWGCMFALLAGVGSAEDRAAAPAVLRVMTFNVRYGTAPDGDNAWPARRAALAARIRSVDPDLLGTQETLAMQRDYLADQLPHLSHWGVGREDGKERGEMTLLFYRTGRFTRTDAGHFWLSETPDQPGSRSWDSSLPRMASWVRLQDKQAADARPIFFVNTHLDHKGERARLASARLLRQRIAQWLQEGTVILTGDFNADEGSAPYQALFGAAAGTPSPIRDAYRLAHPQRVDGEGTFSSFKAGPSSSGRIDWIGISAGWQVRSGEIDRSTREGRGLSDHFPVIAELQPSAP